MHRKKLLGLLEGYGQRFPEEIDVISRTRDFVNQHSDCFSRTLKIGHITGSAWILDTSAKKALLTHHKKLDIWVQPGGHAEDETDAFKVAEREAIEETGLKSLRALSTDLFDLDIHEIPTRKGEPAHFHYDCRFIFQAEGSDEYLVSNESHDLKWVPLESVVSLNPEQSIARMVKKTVS